MGLNYPTGAVLAWATKTRGLTAERVVTIGRLSLNMSPKQQERIRAFLGVTGGPGGPSGGASDDFLRMLCGGATIESLDVSAYEGASIVHDLNTPVPDSLEGQYDLLIDGGSLEHVFNVPMALANYSRMVRPGGRVLIATTANNYMGHGFYQFSPELFYSYFSARNGWALEYVGLAVHPYPSSSLSDRCEMYEVANPSEENARIGLVSGTPALILALARRLTVAEELDDRVIQSDYIALHEESEGSSQDRTVERVRRSGMLDLLPAWLLRYLRGVRELRRYSIRNRTAYRRHTLENWGGEPR